MSAWSEAGARLPALPPERTCGTRLRGLYIYIVASLPWLWADSRAVPAVWAVIGGGGAVGGCHHTVRPRGVVGSAPEILREIYDGK
jgi:hypothetical protein